MNLNCSKNKKIFLFFGVIAALSFLSLSSSALDLANIILRNQGLQSGANESLDKSLEDLVRSPFFKSISLDLYLEKVNMKRDFEDAVLVSSKTTEIFALNRQVEDIVLRSRSGQISDIHIKIDRPLKSKINQGQESIKLENNSEPLPVIFIFSGVQVSRDSVLNLLNPQEPYAFVSMDFLDLPKQSDQSWPSERAAKLPMDIFSIPAKMALMMSWVSQQSWADSSRLSSLGISFGSYLLPFSLNLLQTKRIYMKAVVYSYVGSDFSLILKNNLKEDYENIKILENVFKLLGSFFDPKTHLSEVRSQKFLIVQGDQDEVFPRQSIEIFNQEVPGNKELKWIPGPHIGPERPDQIHSLKNIVKDWMARVL